MNALAIIALAEVNVRGIDDTLLTEWSGHSNARVREIAREEIARRQQPQRPAWMQNLKAKELAR